MSKMALAAYEGGAVGIRANTKEDILAIKETVDLPVIGIVKRDYDHSDVFITATSKEVDELIESQCEVIALDVTLQQRPKETLDELVSYIRTHAPNVEIMADIATVEEAKMPYDLALIILARRYMAILVIRKDNYFIKMTSISKRCTTKC